MPHVLVVEDDQTIQDLLRDLFRLDGFSVATASDGLQALQAVKRRRPDVVVLDLQLPDRPGLDLFRDIQRLDARRPVVFITAHGTADTAIEAMKHGAFVYLVKPLDLEQLQPLSLLKPGDAAPGVFLPSAGNAVYAPLHIEFRDEAARLRFRPPQGVTLFHEFDRFADAFVDLSRLDGLEHLQAMPEVVWVDVDTARPDEGDVKHFLLLALGRVWEVDPRQPPMDSPSAAKSRQSVVAKFVSFINTPKVDPPPGSTEDEKHDLAESVSRVRKAVILGLAFMSGRPEVRDASRISTSV